MKRKHPPQRAPINWDNLRSIHGSATEDVREETVEKMIRSFAKGSAGGTSGLKPQHLKDGVGTKSPIVATLVIDKLTRLVNLLVAMEGRGDIAPFLAGAAL